MIEQRLSESANAGHVPSRRRAKDSPRIVPDHSLPDCVEPHHVTRL